MKTKEVQINGTNVALFHEAETNGPEEEEFMKLQRYIKNLDEAEEILGSNIPSLADQLLIKNASEDIRAKNLLNKL